MKQFALGPACFSNQSLYKSNSFLTGKALLRHMEIEEPMKDPSTGEEIKKETFTVYFQGEQLKLRVKKICEG